MHYFHLAPCFATKLKHKGSIPYQVSAKSVRKSRQTSMPVCISFERMSKYNLIRGEAFISGERVSVIEDSGFTNIEQVITRLLLSLPDEIERPTKVQVRITNLDKRKVQLYQRMLQ